MVHFTFPPHSDRLGRRARASLDLSRLLFLAGSLASCGKSTTGPNPATTGTIITVVQQPPGTKSLAVVSGPSSYAVFVTGTDTLIGLTAGTYMLSDPVATAVDPIVTAFYAGTVTGSPVNVTNADTAHMSASFIVLPGTGQLWVGSNSGAQHFVAGYSSVQLTSNGGATTSLSASAAYVAFDAGSNLWVVDSAGTTITEYLAASLGASGTPSAAVTVTSAALNGASGLVFDRLGDLWVANAVGNTIVEFTASQLAASGNVTPAVTLSGAAFHAPGRLSFDAYGTLWVPNTGSNTVVALAPNLLATNGAPTPTVTLSATASSLAGPQAVAFDEQGDLWVANAAGNTIVEFSNSQQKASGSPAPILTLVVPSISGAPSSLAFDNSGDLWALSTTASGLIEYSAQQISAGGAAAPAITLPVAAGPVTLAFDPPPNGLPIVGPAARGRVNDRKEKMRK
jgi:sugar lactone lactonase YvrE